MKIIIDGRMWSWTGIGRVTRNLVAELQKLDTHNDYTVLLKSSDWTKWRPTQTNFHKVRSDTEPYGLSGQFEFARQLHGLAPDLVHFPHFTVPLLYHGRYVVTINDLTLVHFKNVRGQGLKKLIYDLKYWAMRLVLWHAVRAATHIISISEFVKTDLGKSFAGLPPVSVTYPAVDRATTKPSPIDHIVSGEFLLYVGNSYPHKNLRRLIEAFNLVRQQKPDLSLVIVGADDYFSQEIRRETAGTPGLIFPGYVGDSELAGLYKETAAFVFPSLSEGFGMPPLEAMAQGTAVISSNASCMPEVLGNAAVYFNPRKIDNMADVILKTLANDKKLAELRALGPAQAAKYSWKELAKQTLSVYEQSFADAKPRED